VSDVIRSRQQNAQFAPKFVVYSIRNAFIGEMDVARRAGITAAKNAEIAKAMAAMPRAMGSQLETP